MPTKACVSPAQAQLVCEGLGLDWTKIDWSRVLEIVQSILELVRNRRVMVGVGAGGADCSHRDSALTLLNLGLGVADEAAFLLETLDCDPAPTPPPA